MVSYEFQHRELAETLANLTAALVPKGVIERSDLSSTITRVQRASRLLIAIAASYADSPGV
jgi:hypothetical protein